LIKEQEDVPPTPGQVTAAVLVVVEPHVVTEYAIVVVLSTVKAQARVEPQG